MNNQITFKQYRTIDLLLFSVILAVCEFVAARAAAVWFTDQLYSLSVTALVASVVMMRWGGFAAISAVLGGAVYVLASRGEAAQLLVYAGGNLLSLAALPLLNRCGREKTAGSASRSLFFALGVLLLMQTGRALISLLLGGNAVGAFNFYLTDAITALFTAVVILLIRRLDGVFEEQRAYLIRKQEEFQEEKRQQQIY